MLYRWRIWIGVREKPQAVISIISLWLSEHPSWWVVIVVHSLTGPLNRLTPSLLSLDLDVCDMTDTLIFVIHLHSLLCLFSTYHNNIHSLVLFQTMAKRKILVETQQLRKLHIALVYNIDILIFLYNHDFILTNLRNMWNIL